MTPILNKPNSSFPLNLHHTSYQALERALLAGDPSHVTALTLQYIRTHGYHVLNELKSHPLSDEWFDLIYMSTKEYFSQAKGWVYAVENPMTEGWIKVGLTSQSPEKRLAQLNNEAVLGEFVLIKAWSTHDRFFCESQAHRALQGFPRFKEFFHGDWKAICSVVTSVIEADIRLMQAAGFELPPKDLDE